VPEAAKASEAVIAMLPPASTVADEPIAAVAPLPITTTTIEAETPAEPAAAPAEAARARIDSEEVAPIVTSPPAPTCAPLPIWAVTCLVMTWTSTATPMPADPVVPPRPPAPSTTVVASLAVIVTLWPLPPEVVWFTSAPPAIVACVSRFSTSTRTEPPTAALPLETAPPIAMPVTVTVCLSSGIAGVVSAARPDVAVTARAPAASARTFASRCASVVTVRTLTATAAPTPTLVARPPASASACRPIGAAADTVRAPVEVARASCSTCASVT
jgi:hypothetical protein